MALKRAMRSWMSIAAATAARDDSNSASRESPVLSISVPPAIAMAGRQTSVCADLEMPDGEVLVALHHADETGDVGMKDRGKTALRGSHCETAVNIRLAETLSSG